MCHAINVNGKLKDMFEKDHLFTRIIAILDNNLFIDLIRE